MITACTAMGVTGIGAFAGSAAAWSRQDAEFKGCSEVWFIVDPGDIVYDPPTVAKVVFALPDGSTECRVVEFTQDNTTTIPGQYGDAPVRKVMAGDDEKILGVIFYNRTSDNGRFSSASCMYVNTHRCAMTPHTPAFEDADCVQTALETGGYYCGEESNGNGNGIGKPDVQTLKSSKNKNKNKNK